MGTCQPGGLHLVTLELELKAAGFGNIPAQAIGCLNGPYFDKDYRCLEILAYQALGTVIGETHTWACCCLSFVVFV